MGSSCGAAGGGAMTMGSTASATASQGAMGGGSATAPPAQPAQSLQRMLVDGFLSGATAGSTFAASSLAIDVQKSGWNLALPIVCACNPSGTIANVENTKAARTAQELRRSVRRRANMARRFYLDPSFRAGCRAGRPCCNVASSSWPNPSGQFTAKKLPAAPHTCRFLQVRVHRARPIVISRYCQSDAKRSAFSSAARALASASRTGRFERIARTRRMP